MASVSTPSKTPAPAQTEPPGASPRRRLPFWVELYRSALGKKYTMAITGIIWLGYIFAHMVGNLKLYLGAETINHYGEWLRQSLGYPALPHTWTLWLLRGILIVAIVLHIHAAYALTVMNKRARPISYQSKRDFIAADFAARTMRWTGVIVALFLLWHLADLTWGIKAINPDFVRGDVYSNLVASFSRPAVAFWYIAAMVALGFHVYHGAWSFFQSLGWNSPRFNSWRKMFAIGFTVVVIGGDISFPVAVLAGIIH